jgi:hypothetical protein
VTLEWAHIIVDRRSRLYLLVNSRDEKRGCHAKVPRVEIGPWMCPDYNRHLKCEFADRDALFSLGPPENGADLSQRPSSGDFPRL